MSFANHCILFLFTFYPKITILGGALLYNDPKLEHLALGVSADDNPLVTTVICWLVSVDDSTAEL